MIQRVQCPLGGPLAIPVMIPFNCRLQAHVKNILPALIVTQLIAFAHKRRGHSWECKMRSFFLNDFSSQKKTIKNKENKISDGDYIYKIL